MGREDVRVFGPVKAAIDLFGDKFGEQNSLVKKSQDQSQRTRGLHMSKQESELSKARKTVRDLTLKIEEESNLKAELRIQEPEKLKHRKLDEEQKTLVVKNTDSSGQHGEVMRDLEEVQRDLSKLKLELGSVLEEKNRAETEAKGSYSRIYASSKSVDALRQQIEEVNDEQVLVELAQIEANKELADIEAQRAVEAKKFMSKIEDTEMKTREVLEEIDLSKELETKLALINSDIKMLENEIKIIKEMAMRVSSFRNAKEVQTPLVLKSVLEELKLAKNELARIRDEGFQIMASLDVIRNEIICISEKTAQLRNEDEKVEENVHSINSKILAAKTTFEAVSSSEEKARTIVDNLFLACKHLKTESEASKKEKELICEEEAKLAAQIERNEADLELAEMKLEVVLEELEAVKSSEFVALEKLKILTKKTMMDRDLASKHSSTITISKFEYGYLTSRAAEAEEIADKKVSAAHAWIKALKDNEVNMKMEVARRKINDKREEEGEERFRRQKSIYGKRAEEGESSGNWDENSEVDNSEFDGESSRKSFKKSGNSTPFRRAKLRVLTLPGFQHTRKSSSVNTTERRGKMMPNLGKLFNSKSVENER